jgi:hypothetical protein
MTCQADDVSIKNICFSALTNGVVGYVDEPGHSLPPLSTAGLNVGQASGDPARSDITCLIGDRGHRKTDRMGTRGPPARWAAGPRGSISKHAVGLQRYPPVLLRYLVPALFSAPLAVKRLYTTILHQCCALQSI